MSSDQLESDLKKYQEDLAHIIESFTKNADSKRQAMLKSALENIYTTIGLTLKILNTEYDLSSDDFIVGGQLQVQGGVVSQGNDASTDIPEQSIDGCTILEGVFDGRHMVASNGNQYAVPENYASKSKLVEGDILKLRINHDGTFTFKQINPTLRRRVRGCLYFDPETSQYYAAYNGKTWCVLTASVRYFQGDHNDEVIALIPQDGVSKWAAVENIIKNTSGEDLIATHVGDIGHDTY